MIIAGTVAEYNPFHRGHAWHLSETRRRTGCDFVVVCMAGSVTQRGEAACLSKWTRAQMALRCGADAVFELPALYVPRPAPVFAGAGVDILGGLGCDWLSFGSDVPEALLEAMAGLRREEPAELSEGIRRGLDAGMTHVRAFSEAAAPLLGVSPEVLNAPNAALGCEYLNALRARHPHVRQLIVPRQGAYHADALSPDGFSSATAIRNALARGETDAAMSAVPEAARPLMSFHPMHDPDDLLLFVLRQAAPESLRALADVSEGLEQRMIRCAREASGLDDWLDRVKCKRYTRAHLSRVAMQALLGLTRSLADGHPTPPYARLIGLRKGAEALLGELNRRTKLPIASDPVALRDHPVFRLECRATDLRALLTDDPDSRKQGAEFTRAFVRA